MAEKLPERIQSEQDLEIVKKHLQKLSDEMLVNLIMEQMDKPCGQDILQRLWENQERARREMLIEYDNEIAALCEESEPSVELIETNVRIIMEYLEAEGDVDLKRAGYEMMEERIRYAVDEMRIGQDTGEDWRLLMLVDECEKGLRKT